MQDSINLQKSDCNSLYHSRLIQLIITITQTEASSKHKLPHKEHCYTLKIFYPNEELKSPYT